MGKFKRKAMTLAKNVVSTVESFDDHSMQEKMAKMMAMVEASAQQAEAANRALEETQAELTAKITEL